MADSSVGWDEDSVTWNNVPGLRDELPVEIEYFAFFGFFGGIKVSVLPEIAAAKADNGVLSLYIGLHPQDVPPSDSFSVTFYSLESEINKPSLVKNITSPFIAVETFPDSIQVDVSEPAGGPPEAYHYYLDGVLKHQGPERTFTYDNLVDQQSYQVGVSMMVQGQQTDKSIESVYLGVPSTEITQTDYSYDDNNDAHFVEADWDSAEVDSYNVQVKNLSTGAEELTTNITDNELKYPAQLDVSYEFRVAGVKNGVVGDYSAPKSYTIHTCTYEISLQTEGGSTPTTILERMNLIESGAYAGLIDIDADHYELTTKQHTVEIEGYPSGPDAARASIELDIGDGGNNNDPLRLYDEAFKENIAANNCVDSPTITCRGNLLALNDDPDVGNPYIRNSGFFDYQDLSIETEVYNTTTIGFTDCKPAYSSWNCLIKFIDAAAAINIDETVFYDALRGGATGNISITTAPDPTDSEANFTAVSSGVRVGGVGYAGSPFWAQQFILNEEQAGIVSKIGAYMQEISPLGTIYFYLTRNLAGHADIENPIVQSSIIDINEEAWYYADVSNISLEPDVSYFFAIGINISGDSTELSGESYGFRAIPEPTLVNNMEYLNHRDQWISIDDPLTISLQ